MSHDANVLALRLTRMKFLIELLETACAGNTEQLDILLSLKTELDAVRQSLTPLTP